MRYWCYGGGNQESHCDLLLVKAIVRKLIGYQTEQANLLMFAVGGKASVHDQLGERVSLVANLRESLISRVCGYDSDFSKAGSGCHQRCSKDEERHCCV